MGKSLATVGSLAASPDQFRWLSWSISVATVGRSLAFCTERDEASGNSQENLCAPFYLWHDTDGMNAFPGGAGFAALAQSFGWPSVRTWPVWQAEQAANLAIATHAAREVIGLPPHSALDACRDAEALIASAAIAGGALNGVAQYA